jgi:NTE family protein
VETLLRREPRSPAGAAFASDRFDPLGLTVPIPCEPALARPDDYGLALSGGGFRATLFHLGSLWRLNELGMLPRIARISTVSGGSLLAGFLALGWNNLRFDGDGVATNFEAVVERPVFDFTARRLDAFIIVGGLSPLVGVGRLLEAVLDRLITRGATLADLPAASPGLAPRFTFNATHLASGTNWRFERGFAGNYRLGVICRPSIPLAHAIAASAAFPPLASPVVLEVDPAEFEPLPGADLHEHEDLRRKVLLVDGGAYDNSGVEALVGRVRHLLTSDAGGNLTVSRHRMRYALWTVQIKRTLDIAVDQGRAQRRRSLIEGARAARALGNWQKDPPDFDFPEHVALWRTALDPNDFATLPAELRIDARWPPLLSALPTRMWPMDDADRRRLVNWGYLTADVVLRAFVPELRDTSPAGRLPYPEFDFAPR